MVRLCMQLQMRRGLAKRHAKMKCAWIQISRKMYACMEDTIYSAWSGRIWFPGTGNSRSPSTIAILDKKKSVWHPYKWLKLTSSLHCVDVRLSSYIIVQTNCPDRWERSGAISFLISSVSCTPTCSKSTAVTCKRSVVQRTIRFVNILFAFCLHNIKFLKQLSKRHM